MILVHHELIINFRNFKILFAENITSTDWQISEKGIQNVINVNNNNIFESFTSIEVNILKIYGMQKFIVAELEIYIK